MAHSHCTGPGPGPGQGQGPGSGPGNDGFLCYAMYCNTIKVQGQRQATIVFCCAPPDPCPCPGPEP